ncbi:hypothetical protein V5P93_007405 [Actinokineospora auranticolor]|uniref:Uncharacterized protein n=1 Tax=Actinokineospora auranticolor TaxID=155976 RepID=A0A2S6GSA4_9PSEU|nr:hypothetical protein [Actinokineospora auranticolor]PPK68057.1 hypothetical protein CLV40_106290 [Actinokineospora auranticolor]
MDQQRTKETGAWRRVLSRTLLVLGGTVASTAAAWAVTTATAGADVATDLQDGLRSTADSVPVLDTPAAADTEELVTGLTDRLGVVLGEPVDRTVTSAVGQRAVRAAKAVDDFGHDLAQLPVLDPGRFDLPGGTPAAPRVAAVVEVVRHVVPNPITTRALDTAPAAERFDGSATELPGVAVPGPEQVVTEQPAAGVPAAAPHRSGVVGASAVMFGASAHGYATPDLPGSRERSEPEAPALPTGPSPLAPLSMPAPVSTGHSPGGGSADATGLALVATVPASTESGPVRALRTAPALALAAVDAQPGVTPD